MFYDPSEWTVGLFCLPLLSCHTHCPWSSFALGAYPFLFILSPSAVFPRRPLVAGAGSALITLQVPPHRRSPIYKHISSLVFSDFPKMLGSSSRLVLLQISAIVLGIATAAPISIRDDMTITKDALARVLLSQPTTITFTDTVKT